MKVIFQKNLGKNRYDISWDFSVIKVIRYGLDE
jgi:hypothetical protein